MNAELINALNFTPDTSSIYLLEKLTENSGFFGAQKKLMYAIKNIQQLGYNSVDTEFLSIKTHLYISAIENTSQFSSDYYNVIIFKGSSSDENIHAFMRLCRIHCRHNEEMNFWDFFYSLSSLFQPIREQQFKNLIGFWGELAFMRLIYTSVGYDISSAWHVSGSYSKYDFALKKANIEIKTLIGDMPVVKLKHSQLFNMDKNYLAVICTSNDDSGETIVDLINDLRNTPEHFSSLNFNINIERELQRISPTEANKNKFKLLQMFLYSAEDIKVFKEIPYSISDLQYNYDLSDTASLDITDICNMFSDNTDFII